MSYQLKKVMLAASDLPAHMPAENKTVHTSSLKPGWSFTKIPLFVSLENRWIKQAGTQTLQAQLQKCITPAALQAEDKFLRDRK
jgi:hypothetical protein